MSHPKHIDIKESLEELRVLHKESRGIAKRRVAMLVELKKHGGNGVSKRDLSLRLGVNHNSITKWRGLYESGGISSLLDDGRKDNGSSSVVGQEEHKRLEALLNDPRNGIAGYVELLDWVSRELKMEMKYITLVKYVNRHFGTKIKVARKSHVRKDPSAVEAFKKTSG